jgi:ribonucleoside-diphosphate reductase alpha chain
MHNSKPETFRSPLGREIFYRKYALSQSDTWEQLVHRCVDDVVGSMGGTKAPLMSKADRDVLEYEIMIPMKFVPGGRYLYYAGRELHAWNNCFLLGAEEDTREEWARLCQAAMSCLSMGGGIGIDYSVLRPEGRMLKRTGGRASGPIPLMQAINEIGRNVMQGGSRRSAIYASLDRTHDDIWKFLHAKNWDQKMIPGTDLSFSDMKLRDFNWAAPLDMTNISVNYKTDWLELSNRAEDPVFLENVKQALRTGEPGFSFNFYGQENETLRNACTEVTSADDSDCCNLGSINLSRIENIDELRTATRLASMFLVAGTLRADLPYEKIRVVREKNRRLGLGLMGIHEWLLARGERYEVTEELHNWLGVWREESIKAADEHCDRFFINRPIAYRSIAPTGTLGLLAGTTTGIEPLYAVAYKRRYLVDGTRWHFQYAVDSTAETLIDRGIAAESIVDTAHGLSADPERRIKFQYDIQAYVDQAISSTINLPHWGSETNNESTVKSFAETLAKYAPGLRGFTCYPDGSRGGQPLVSCSYEEATKHKGVIFEENEDAGCKSGVCGI